MPPRGTFGTPPPPSRRWMLFVDGENFTIRGQHLAKNKGIQLTESPWFRQDVFLWFRSSTGTASLLTLPEVHLPLQDHAVRAFYYTTTTGDEQRFQEVQDQIHSAGFAPRVFRKSTKGRKTKGVDISLATDLLSNAYLDNYDVAVLAAGDGDFAPLVREAQRLGKVIYIHFFAEADAGLNRELAITADRFVDATPRFLDCWSQ